MKNQHDMLAYFKSCMLFNLYVFRNNPDCQSPSHLITRSDLFIQENCIPYILTPPCMANRSAQNGNEIRTHCGAHSNLIIRLVVSSFWQIPRNGRTESQGIIKIEIPHYHSRRVSENLQCLQSYLIPCQISKLQYFNRTRIRRVIPSFFFSPFIVGVK